MKKILDNVLKKKTIDIINRLGKGISEIVIEIEVSFGKVESIEYIKNENRILIHCFYDDFDISFDFEDLDEWDKITIYQSLKTI
jgi:uncharacterized protein YdeI (YjbR/CyaY-like superfamily)